MTVHATACQGLRECGRADIDNSCHWSSDNRYLCLMYAALTVCWLCKLGLQACCGLVCRTAMSPHPTHEHISLQNFRACHDAGQSGREKDLSCDGWTRQITFWVNACCRLKSKVRTCMQKVVPGLGQTAAYGCLHGMGPSLRIL